jgi:hypothetical protein
MNPAWQLDYANRHGSMDLGSGLALATQASMLYDYDSWDEHTPLADIDFTSAPFWLCAPDRLPQPVWDVDDLVQALARSR